jgi:hypothetical protein
MYSEAAVLTIVITSEAVRSLQSHFIRAHGALCRLCEPLHLQYNVEIIIMEFKPFSHGGLQMDKSLDFPKAVKNKHLTEEMSLQCPNEWHSLLAPQ